jgi:hypothetical protein
MTLVSVLWGVRAHLKTTCQEEFSNVGDSIIPISALGMGTFTQQLLLYPLRNVFSDRGIFMQARYMATGMRTPPLGLFENIRPRVSCLEMTSR